MMRAAAAGLPLSLEGAGGALRIEWSKLVCGKALIRYFSQPCALTRETAGARVQAEDRMRRITGINNPNSIKQITVWLATRGVEEDSPALKAEGYETSFYRKD